MTLPNDPAATIFYEMLDDTHPKMVEALYIAAISPWYDIPFFVAIREDDDGKSEALVPRLARYSFVVPVSGEGETAVYSIRADERDLLQRHWIENSPDNYYTANQNAYSYRHANPDPENPDAQIQTELFHLLFANFDAGIDQLIDNFRIYFTERRLTALDRLLETAEHVRTYLALLEFPELKRLDHILVHLRARSGQLRGQWRESITPLRDLLENPDLARNLAPYIIRAFGLALSNTGLYVEAIEQLDHSLNEFKERAENAPNPRLLEAEQGYTHIALGDAYVSLAIQARGYDQNVSVIPFGHFQFLTHALNFFISLPLVFYLTFYLGYQVWLPRFWPVYRDLDWLIARLFATAARHYKLADPLLEGRGHEDGGLEHIPVQEAVAADEKLAYLYLRMGAAHEAHELFEYLLSEKEAPLSEFRRATVRVGNGQALVQLGQPQAAFETVEAAMPVLEFYEESTLLAEARTVLAQALLGLREGEGETAVTAAIYHLGEAMNLHQVQLNHAKATEVSEFLLSVAHEDGEQALDEDHRQDAEYVANTLKVRHYPLSYRHSVTTIFRRLVVILLAIVVFFIMPVVTIELDIDTSTVPTINFDAAPLLDPNNADFTPDLNQGVTALNLAQPPNPHVLVSLGVQLFFGYILASTGLGLLAMLMTPLRIVQKAGDAQVVRLDEKGLAVGSGWTQRTIRWPEAKEYTKADIRLLSGWLPDSSYSVLQSEEERIVIRGTVAWYPSLQDRIPTKLPNSTQQTVLSHSIVRSRMGILFAITAVILFTLSVLGRVTPTIIPVDFLFSYSLADIYPFIYLGFFIPMGWWFISQPLRKRWHIQPRTTPYIPVGLFGLGFGIARIATQFRPWFTVPDIYPSSMIILLIVTAVLIIIRTKKENGEPVQPTWFRIPTLIIGSIITLFMIAHIGYSVWSYHFLTIGNRNRDEALRAQNDPALQEKLAQDAVTAYTQAIEASEKKLLGILDIHAPVNQRFGLPQPSDFTWLLATNGKAAMETQLGNYQTAVDDYADLIQVTDKQAEAYVSRAIAYQGLAASAETAQEMAEAEESGDMGVNPQEDANIKAIANFNTAIDLAPNNANYYLWRAVSYHSLGDIEQAQADYESSLAVTITPNSVPLNDLSRSQALTGLGWIEYSRGNHEGALDYFEDAGTADPDSADALLGQGYVQYTLRQYDNALEIWQTAVEKEPNNPTLHNSLGTLYWRVGTLGTNYNSLSGSDRCSQKFLTDADKIQARDLLQNSVTSFEQSLTLSNQTNEDLAFTHRTIAQVQFLLRNCPELDKAEVLQTAVSHYQDAAQLVPDNPLYWHMQGRLSYSIWQALPPHTGPAARVWLFDGLEANAKALELDDVDAEDYRPNAWDKALEQAISTTLVRGDNRYVDGQYDVALDYYFLMATNQPDNAEAAFKVALAHQALGNKGEAEQWLAQGIERAQQQNQPELAQLYEDKWEVYQRFQQALTATEARNWREAASLYDEAINAAARIEAIDIVEAAASDLRDYLLENESVNPADVYWPLDYATPTGALSLTAQRNDLFWRYRSDFGYRLTQGLFNALPGREAQYAQIFTSVTSDIEQAAELEEKRHAEQADFLTNSNIGWLYLQRGDDYFAAGEYASALADYDEALRLIRPESEDGLSDLTNATFKAALTAVATQDYARAIIWYDRATQQATQSENINSVRTAATALGEFILEHPEIDLLDAYWPLAESSELNNGQQWVDISQEDLYWRFRAEFGFRFIVTLFNARVGDEAQFEEMFATVISDSNRAVELDDSHLEDQAFFVDSNLGWFYLQRGDEQFKAENYAGARADFQEALWRIQPNSPSAQEDLMTANLKAGLTALLLEDTEQSASLFNRGIELAAELEKLDAVLNAANSLSVALLENPQLDPAMAYWPLAEDRGGRETAVSSLPNADLYWRYRAEFGFRLISRLFSASSGNESVYERMFVEVINDIEAANTLNAEAHQIKRDFFVDANTGWFYLQRGNEHRRDGRFAQALTDYEEAIERMRPDSDNARNDLLDAIFNAGLTAVALDDFAQAQEWYRQGVSLATEFEEENALSRAGKNLELLLFGRELD